MAKSHSSLPKAPTKAENQDALPALFAKAFAAKLSKDAPSSDGTIKSGGGMAARQKVGSASPHVRASRARAAPDQHAVVMFATNVLIDALKDLRVTALSVDPAIEVLIAPIARLVPEVGRQQSEQTIEALVKALLPKIDPLGAVTSRIERANAEARVGFLKTIELLQAAELAELARHKAGNKSATGTRWKGAGRAFSVPHDGKELFPAFQFADGRPKPAIAKILEALPKTMSGWQIAFWFVSSNPFLDGKEPYLRLGNEEAVVAAATAEADGFVG